MDLLVSRPVVIVLAVIGALLAVGASVMRSTGKLSEDGARRLNRVGYIAIGASMLLFALAGLRGMPP